MSGQESSRNVNARKAIEMLRSDMTNIELMHAFKISPKGFADLLKQLYENKLIGIDDLAKRGIKYRVIKKPQLPEAVSVVHPPADPVQQEEPEEFLDTVALTELLGGPLGGTHRDKTGSEKTEAEINLPEKSEDADPQDKKNRFSLINLFGKK